MTESTTEIVAESSDWHREQTAHGLLVLAHEAAKRAGFFTALAQHVQLPIKKVDYSVHDKLATLWASILVGCDHTVEINAKLGPEERALAALFGLERFPDQSGINRLLHACTETTVGQMRQLHLQLLVANSRATRRHLRTRLRRGRVIYVDFDQHGITVSGKHYELAEAGYFTRTRSHRGYQLSMGFIGGHLGEVVDEYFDGGATAAGARIDDLLASVAQLADGCRIPRTQFVIRGDAQYGTPAIIAKITAAGFGFLLKGISPKRAECVARALDEAAFVRVSPRAEGEPRWAADVGEREFVDDSGTREKPKAVVRARAIVVKWEEATMRRKRPGPSTRARQALEAVEVRSCYAMLLTSLKADVLPVAMALDHYDDRATIERYFRDEQCAFGTRSVRTHKAAGAAVFQWMVAIANNLLRWMRATYLADTALEAYGAERLVRRVFQIPAQLVRTGTRLRVIFPKGNALVASILEAMAQLTAVPDAAKLAPPGAAQ